MKPPLDQFADRMVSLGEIPEFIEGLVQEKKVHPATILAALSNVCDMSQLLSTTAIRLKAPDRDDRLDQDPLGPTEA